jgi:RsiW-degrading membrane proteinase PrsW (M82 family)
VKAPSRTIRITRRALFVFAAAVMALFGVMFSTAALAAGVKSIDVLAMVFLLGAAASLFALVVWYLLQLQARSRRR